jgi:hypothetical protein
LTGSFPVHGVERAIDGLIERAKRRGVAHYATVG